MSSLGLSGKNHTSWLASVEIQQITPDNPETRLELHRRFSDLAEAKNPEFKLLYGWQYPCALLSTEPLQEEILLVPTDQKQNPLGYCYIQIHSDCLNIEMIEIFQKDSGLGTRMLEQIKALGMPIIAKTFLIIDDQERASASQEYQARNNFYLKNGFEITEYNISSTTFLWEPNSEESTAIS